MEERRKREELTPRHVIDSPQPWTPFGWSPFRADDERPWILYVVVVLMVLLVVVGLSLFFGWFGLPRAF